MSHVYVFTKSIYELQVGCGKSSMLSAILGEMYLRSGDVFITTNKGVPPTIAYCDQRPWIVNATVRENIIFGKDYDEERFQRAIDAASMHDDLEILPGGEDAEIGEKGINLSGGIFQIKTVFQSLYCDLFLFRHTVYILCCAVE